MPGEEEEATEGAVGGATAVVAVAEVVAAVAVVAVVAAAAVEWRDGDELGEVAGTGLSPAKVWVRETFSHVMAACDR
ncbi:hypothetical protein AB870_00515 [Pandoraea faecigallinarum]|uniref:Uncharacterized protein n=1 Tax=Pandoraea faecigallinarum TaxID=656179 RepID=A0A0H3WNQ0_9BURK|nr:hypothetical protein AB870_00515 [Pandoraea faecigallinarum]